MTKLTAAGLRKRLQGCHGQQEALVALGAEIGYQAAELSPVDLHTLHAEVSDDQSPIGRALKCYLAGEAEVLFKALTQGEFNTDDPSIDELLRILCALRLSEANHVLSTGDDPLRYVFERETESLIAAESKFHELVDLKAHVLQGRPV